MSRIVHAMQSPIDIKLSRRASAQPNGFPRSTCRLGVEHWVIASCGSVENVAVGWTPTQLGYVEFLMSGSAILFGGMDMKVGLGQLATRDESKQILEVWQQRVGFGNGVRSAKETRLFVLWYGTTTKSANGLHQITIVRVGRKQRQKAYKRGTAGHKGQSRNAQRTIPTNQRGSRLSVQTERTFVVRSIHSDGKHPQYHREEKAHDG